MRHLNKWPRVYKDNLVEPEAEETLDDFDETVSADLESTRRDLRALTFRSGNHEAEALRMKMVDALTAEVAEQRHQIAKIVQTLNIKASKKTFEGFSTALTAKTDKRLDNIRNLVLAAVAVISLLLTWIKVKG